MAFMVRKITRLTSCMHQHCISPAFMHQVHQANKVGERVAVAGELDGVHGQEDHQVDQLHAQEPVSTLHSSWPQPTELTAVPRPMAAVPIWMQGNNDSTHAQQM